MKQLSAPGHCVRLDRFHTCVLTKHMQYLAHLVLLDLRMGLATDLIPKTPEDLGE